MNPVMTDEHPSASTRLIRVAANISGPISDGKGEARALPAQVSQLDRIPGLVQRAREGDREEFGELYRIHHPSVFRLARFYLGEGAEDAVSEIFLRAWAGLPRYRDTGAPFAAWLYGIGRHVVADELARRRRTEPRAELPDGPAETPMEDRLVLAAAIERLPKEQRQVIELKYLVGMTNPELARAMDTTMGAVNAKQWRALRALQGILEER